MSLKHPTFPVGSVVRLANVPSVKRWDYFGCSVGTIGKVAAIGLRDDDQRILVEHSNGAYMGMFWPSELERV